MPSIYSQFIDKFGGITTPCVRRNKKLSGPPLVASSGEKISLAEHIIFLSEDNSSPEVVYTTTKSLVKPYTYLWVADPDGFKILLETTPVESERKHACHTNITGGTPAFHGGELWFIGEKHICLNHSSGRYDYGEDAEKQAVVDYLVAIGYQVEHDEI